VWVALPLSFKPPKAALFFGGSMNTEKKRAYYKEWKTRNKKICTEKYREYRKSKFYKTPWDRTYYNIVQRCRNKNEIRYGGRGIKNNITKEELKFLWFRDKAYLMKQPNIHRINNDGNYDIGNCVYMEKIEHDLVGSGRTCSVCDEKHLGKGLCEKHYNKQYHHIRYWNKKCRNRGEK
jgi:hypothetical protein